MGGAEDPLVTDKENGYFLVFGKELGNICLDKHKIDKAAYKPLVAQAKKDVNGAELPPRAFTSEPDGKSGNRRLKFNCSYCPFKKACWPGLRTFLYSSGPRYLTTVKRVPDVTEVR